MVVNDGMRGSFETCEDFAGERPEITGFSVRLHAELFCTLFVYEEGSSLLL
jgi:hypothetical protein